MWVHFLQSFFRLKELRLAEHICRETGFPSTFYLLGAGPDLFCSFFPIIWRQVKLFERDDNKLFRIRCRWS